MNDQTQTLFLLFLIIFGFGSPVRADEGGAGAPPAVPYVWRNVEIVGGGFVSGIIFHPTKQGVVYARTDIGGPYRWNTKTKRWIPLLDWLPPEDWNLYGAESIGLDPTDANRVYVAAGTYTNDWAGNGAILRSTDQGKTWRRTDMPFKLGGNMDGRSIGERLAVDPNKNNILYFGSRDNGLWRSDDFGATWKQVENFPIKAKTNGVGVGFVIFDAKSGRSGKATATIYIGVPSPGVTLYRSRDAGATWEPVPGQPTGFLPHHGVLASEGTLYLTYGNAPGPNGMSDGAVWKLDTKTDAWTDITPLKPGGPNAGTFGYAGLSVEAKNPNAVIVTSMDKWSSGDDIFRSVDGGKTWKTFKPKAVRDSVASPFLNWGRPSADLGHWIGDIEIDPFDSNHVLYVTGATIWGSDDAAGIDADKPTHWTVRAMGLEETAVLDLLSPPSGAPLLSALGDIGGFKHDDLTVAPPNGMYANPFISSTNSMDFAEENPSFVVRVGGGDKGKRGAHSADGGATWTPFPAEPEGTRGGGAIAVSADGSAILWASYQGVPSASKDKGATWTACAGLPNGVRRIVADRVNPARFYALVNNGATVFVSADGGVTFAATGPDPSKGNGRLRALPGKEGELWLSAGGDGLYHSADSGATFQKMLSVQQADDFGFGRAAPGQTHPALYLTGRIADLTGIFRSDDAGASWARIDDDQHRFGTRNLIIGDPRIYGRVYLGTNGRGILYADPVGAGEAKNKTPSSP